ncbi:hypothetical protein IFO69_01170 [Echinicola sp. CAU 1574]|uniref:RadC-like JAB domain-containing protein n=1 Tax=Echinicola arenosa TaxID=2774144 RepID=A0ABR9AFA8_9BACT|nr:hypothetical protein [Echinicola arenosa]
MKASAMILAHNHSSGCLKPSHQGRDLTEKMIKSGELSQKTTYNFK